MVRNSITSSCVVLYNMCISPHNYVGHVDVVDSLFEYFDGKTYLDYNDGWDTHSPAFTDELDRPDDTETVCGDDTQCIFDYAVTGNVSFAIATHATTVNNQETQDILSKCVW